MNDSRFQSVVLLHDQDDNPDGRMGDLARILGETHPNVHFLRPSLPPRLENFDILAARYRPMFQANSLIVGEGHGGLRAIAFQERFEPLNLSVVAINPPLGDELWQPSHMLHSFALDRVVLYSSQNEALRNTKPEEWAEYSSRSFDVPWLAGGVQKAVYATSYLVSTIMRGLDVAKEVASMPLAQSETSSI
jgi:hypothetical protein